MYLISMIKVFK